LLSRGWVYQERLLPPRMVHFTLYELLFECREGFWCGCGIYKSPGHNQVTPKFTYNQMLLDGDSDNLEIWHEMVSEYSHLGLTHPQDKLPAISGIAKQLKSNSASSQELGEYLAGLWEANIEYDLLWYSADRVRLFKRPQPRSAPSWSWASVDGAVAFEKLTNLHRSGQYTIKFLGHEISPTGPDIFGQLRSGHLTISGFITKGSIDHISNGGTIRDEVKHHGFSPIFVPDYSSGAAGDAYVPPGEIFFLMMGIHFNPTHEKAHFSLFLTLYCVNSALSHFERIGISYAPKKHFDEDWMKAWAEERVIILV